MIAERLTQKKSLININLHAIMISLRPPYIYKINTKGGT